MYIPQHFEIDDLSDVHAAMRAARLANLVTSSAGGLISTPLPLFLDECESEFGVLYGHMSRANPQWNAPIDSEALAIFTGPEAYISPSWYPTKQQTGKVVPTWNYVAVHAYGVPEFFQDEDRLLQVVSKLTNLHEAGRDQPWAVADAPDAFIKKQLGGIIGLRMPIIRLEGKCKMSQNRTAEDRVGVADGLARSDRASDQYVSPLIPREKG